jgi:hypothetical protein
MPLIIAASIADGRASVTYAGWVASAVLLGQLLAALVLPALGIRIVQRRLALGFAAMLLAGLLGTLPESSVGLLVGWFVAGLCSGALQYVGITAAAASPRLTLAFALRLGVVMIVAGIIAASVRIVGTFTSYSSTLTALAAVAAIVAATGLAFYRAPFDIGPPATSGRGNLRPTRIAGLATLLFLFVGQTGILAYAIQGATQRGVPLADAALTLAAIKFVVGAWLIYSGLRSASLRRQRIFAIGLLLALSVLTISVAEDIGTFFLGFLLFEITFNSLSAKLQAKVVELAPDLGRSWLTATMLLGAAFGPPLYGSAIELGQGPYFIALAVISAVMPAMWSARSAR